VSYRALAVVPVLLTAALAAGMYLLVPHDAFVLAVQLEVDASKLVALAGMIAAALAFERGDYLRRGWGAWAANFALLLARDATLPFEGTMSHGAFVAVRGLLVGVGNASMVYGTWTLARAWGVAGLEYAGTKTARRLTIALAVLAAIAFAGPTTVVDVRDAFTPGGLRFDSLASDAGDLLSLPLLAPVALTALAVQGGTLRWPWTILTSSLVAWLLYDAVYTMPEYVHVARAPAQLASEQLHALAGLLACAAGLAQRKAVTDDDDGAAEAPAQARHDRPGAEG
jgi:hypothetical protein